MHRGTRGQSYTYELLYAGEGKNGSRFVLGLLDAEKKSPENGNYDHEWAGSEAGWSGQTEKRSAPGRPLVGGQSGGGRSKQESDTTQDNPENRVKPPKSTYQGSRENRGAVVAAAASYLRGE